MTFEDRARDAMSANVKPVVFLRWGGRMVCLRWFVDAYCGDAGEPGVMLRIEQIQLVGGLAGWLASIKNERVRQVWAGEGRPTQGGALANLERSVAAMSRGLRLPAGH